MYQLTLDDWIYWLSPFSNVILLQYRYWVYMSLV